MGKLIEEGDYSLEWSRGGCIWRLPSGTEYPLCVENYVSLIPHGGFPPPEAVDDVVKIASTDAVRLFVKRIRDKRPTFEVTAENAGSIARICQRFDGLPLAIELAAAHGSLLEPEMLENRLGGSLEILKDKRRDLDPRHRTLRQTIAWSDALLSEAERRLLRGVSVFAGGFDVAAAEDVLRHLDSVDILGGLESLVTKSLLPVRRGARPDRAGSRSRP